jgi:hypothetical protein
MLTTSEGQFPETALRPICDDSWRSEGKRPKLFESRAAGRVFGTPGATLRSIQIRCTLSRGICPQDGCNPFLTVLPQGVIYFVVIAALLVLFKRLYRYHKLKRTPFAFPFAFRPYPTAVQFHQLLRQRKTQPGSLKSTAF